MNAPSPPMHTPLGTPTKLSPVKNYPIPGKKRKRIILKDKENLSSTANTVFNALADKETTPTKKRRFAQDRIKFSKSSIREHLNRKRDLFALTLAAVYKTQLHFELGTTHAQGEPSKKLTVRVDERNFRSKMNAAHSSSVPVLYAYDLKEWNDWKSGLSDKKPKGRVYLKNSQYDCEQNSTLNLPKFINDADIAVEGRNQDDKFRARALEIINAAAQGSITISEGVKQFHEEFEKVVDQELASLRSMPPEKSSLKIKVMEIYKRQMHRFSDLLGDFRYEDKFFLLPSTLGMPAQEREKIYTAQSKAIQRNFEEQTHASRLISPLKKSGLKGSKKTPHGYARVLKFDILQRAEDQEAKSRMQHLFLLSESQLKEEEEEDLSAAQKLLANNDLSEEYAEFYKAFNRRAAALKQNEREYQASLLKYYAELNGFSEEEMLAAYNKASLNPMEKEELSNILAGKATLSDYQIEQFAALLKINRELFNLKL